MHGNSTTRKRCKTLEVAHLIFFLARIPRIDTSSLYVVLNFLFSQKKNFPGSSLLNGFVRMILELEDEIITKAVPYNTAF